ncbi:hypothetical protein JTB14_011581 [Gonioctena quinquepunctata]|nr:hypothetical protein JTB14_011581 [Gonioctena quinquepunctata]
MNGEREIGVPGPINDFVIGTININSLKNKRLAVKNLLLSHNIQILGIVDTKLKHIPNFSETEVSSAETRENAKAKGEPQVIVERDKRIQEMEEEKDRIEKNKREIIKNLREKEAGKQETQVKQRNEGKSRAFFRTPLKEKLSTEATESDRSHDSKRKHTGRVELVQIERTPQKDRRRYKNKSVRAEQFLRTQDELSDLEASRPKVDGANAHTSSPAENQCMDPRPPQNLISGRGHDEFPVLPQPDTRGQQSRIGHAAPTRPQAERLEKRARRIYDAAPTRGGKHGTA